MSKYDVSSTGSLNLYVAGNYEFAKLKLFETSGNTITVDIGSGSGLADIANDVVVSASGFIDLFNPSNVQILKTFFSETSDTEIWLSVVSGTGILNVIGKQEKSF